jgi:hypothetical protein
MFSLRIETKVLMWPVFEKKKKPENVPESWGTNVRYEGSGNADLAWLKTVVRGKQPFVAYTLIKFILGMNFPSIKNITFCRTENIIL